MIDAMMGAGLKHALLDVWEDIPKLRGQPERWMEFPDAHFDFLGKNLTPWVKNAWPQVKHALSDGIATYDWVMKNKPDAVVVWLDEYPRWRGAAMAARDLKIPAIEIVHGNTHIIQLDHWSTKKYVTHALGSWEAHDWYAWYNLPVQFVATGSIQQDIYVGKDPKQLRDTSRFELNIPAHAQVVTVLTDAVFARSPWQDPGFYYGAFVEFVKAWKMARAIIPGLQLVVKTHPYEKIPETGGKVTTEDYAHLLKRWGIEEDITIVDDPLILALAPADVVVSRPSSALATALHLGIPCLVYSEQPFFDRAKYPGRGFMVATEPPEILSHLTAMLYDDDLIKLLVKGTVAGARYFSGAGGATHRVAQAIRQIARGEEPHESCWGPLP